MKAPDASRTLDAWRNERAFPVLTPHQAQQLGAGRRRRAVMRGDVLLDVGDKTVPLCALARQPPRSYRNN